MARKTMRFRWVFLIQLATGLGVMAVSRLVWASTHSMWTGYGAVYAVAVAVAVVAVVGRKVRRLRHSDQTLRDLLLRRRQLARAGVESPDQLHAQAPMAAAVVALVSFPAAILALVAAPSAGGLDLPPAADGRLQLWCIAAVVLIALVGVDSWFGPGISARVLATDWFTAAAVGFTIALAAAPPLMISHRVDVRVAWLGVAVAQLVWSFGGMFLCGAVSERRKRRLYRSADTTLDSSAGSFAEPGIEGYYDLILQSPGDRKIQVIMEIRRVTNTGMKEAKDLVDNAPGLVLQQVSGDRADQAKALLERLGATVIVSGDPGWG